MRRWLPLVAVAAVVSLALSPTTPAAAGSVGPRLCADLATGSFTMVNLGDSVADGNPGAPNAYDRWPAVLERLLPPGSHVWDGAEPGSRLADYGPGARFRGHIDRTGNPTAVAVNWRLNDQWYLQPIAAWMAEFRALIADIRTKAPTTTVLFLISPWALDPKLDQVNGPHQQDYVNALYALRAETPNSLLVDWSAGFPPRGGQDWLGQMRYDLVHPLPVGQKQQAVQIWQALTSYCEGATP